MGKILGSVILGMVIGAAVAEAIQKCNPNIVGDVKKKFRDGLRALGDAFNEGYRDVSGEIRAAGTE